MALHILVIEDEDSIADFVVRGLREEGFTVERSSNGNDAWHQLKNASWDVVLLDWMMPVMNGVEFLRQLRQVKRRANGQDRDPSKLVGTRAAPIGNQRHRVVDARHALEIRVERIEE